MDIFAKKRAKFFSKKCLTKRGGDVIIESRKSEAFQTLAVFPILDLRDKKHVRLYIIIKLYSLDMLHHANIFKPYRIRG